MTEAHVRIDDGMKRGPRKSRNGVRKRDPETGQSMAVIPADLLPATVLQRYLGDESTAVIAASYGVSRSRLHQWLLEHAEDHWKKAQVARALTALEKAKDGLDGADDPLELARAREQLRGAQWELERLYSRIFGIKQELTVDISHHVTIEHTLEAGAADLLARIRPSVAGMPNAAVLPPVLTIDQKDSQS